MKEKIGLIIGVISAGERKVYLSESAKKWERYYMDPRSYLKKVTNNDNSTFVDFICYGDDVALYYINKSIDGRPGDAVFGMITIPSNISISGEKLEDIINQTREELAKTEYDSSKLDELYSTPYDIRAEIKSCTNSIENERFAVQKYGQNTDFHLYELLDKNLFSTCYNSFKAVFLINEDDKIIPNEDVEEINQELIDSFSVLKYPKGYEHELLIKNTPFTSDYQTKYGSVIEVDVRRKGYISERISVIIDSQTVNIEKQLRQIQWEILVKKTWFKFIDAETNDRITNFSIKINDIEILENTPISESTLRNAKVYVKAPGYNDFNFSYMEAARAWQAKGFDITLCKLKRAPKTYEYYIKDNEYDIHFNIEGAYFDARKSPLSMYEVSKIKSTKEGEEIYLIKSSRFKKKDIYIAIGVVLVLFSLGIWIGAKIYENMNSHIGKQEFQSELNVAVNNAVEDVVSYIAHENFDALLSKYQCLNNNVNCTSIKEKFNKAKGGQITPENMQNKTNSGTISTLLKGKKWIANEFSDAGYKKLYDALNQYEYGEVVRLYNTLCSDIDFSSEEYSTWKSIIETCKGETNPNTGKTYSNDGSITLSLWIGKAKKNIGSTPDYSVLKRDTWNKDDFTNANLEQLFFDLQNFDFAKIIKYKQYFNTYTQERIEKVEKYYKNNNKYPSINKMEQSSIKVFEWRQKIDNATANTQRIGGLG